MLTVVGKMLRKVVINGVVESNETETGGEKCGFREDGNISDQIFST